MQWLESYLSEKQHEVKSKHCWGSKLEILLLEKIPATSFSVATGRWIRLNYKLRRKNLKTSAGNNPNNGPFFS